MTAQTPTPTATVTASSAGALCQRLREAGIPAETLEVLLGEALDRLQDPDCRLSLDAYHALWAMAIHETGDEALGLHMGENVQPDKMGLVGHIFFNAATLGEALQQFSRLYALVNQAVQAEMEIRKDQVHLRYRCADPALYCIADMERSLTVAVCRARHFIHAKLVIERIAFAHPKPAYADEYDRIFQCPVVFDAPACELVFPARYLDYALPRRNPYLHQALLAHVEPLIAKFSTRRSFTQRVRKLVWKQLAKGEVDAESIAASLHMSRQTLYRKLKAEDQEFKDLVEAVRQKKALKYLREDRYGLNEIAFLLGFSELSAFSRAFKRWQGVSPAAYRDQLRRESGQ